MATNTTRLAQLRKRHANKCAACNQQYSKPMTDIELKNRLVYMMNDPTQVKVRASFKEKFPDRYVRLVES